MPPLKDRTGLRYGRLLVLERSFPNNKFNHVMWKCQCDCGNVTITSGNNLENGSTKSCGCLSTDTRRALGHSHKIDLTGKRFGKLVVLEDTGRVERVGSNKAGYVHFYKCQCDCGNTVIVRGGNLTSGNSMSCGCLKASHGEYLINQILLNNNIEFVKEFSIKINSSNFRFDFFVTDSNSKIKYAIEFDGEQHFRYTSGGWSCDLEEIKRRDDIKNQYCWDNNIPLIRIPWFHKPIILEDLLLDTSSYVLTKNNAGEYYAIRKI